MLQNSSPLPSHLLPFGTTVLLLGLLVGCDALPGTDPTDPPPDYPFEHSDQTTVDPGIDVTLQVPDTVSTGDPFKIATRIDNKSGGMVTVTTGNVALWDVGIYDGDEPVPVKGSMLMYATVVTDHNIDPGATSSTTDLQAVHSSNDDQPIAPGTYTTRLTLNWRIGDTTVKDTLETQIVFQNE